MTTTSPSNNNNNNNAPTTITEPTEEFRASCQTAATQLVYGDGMATLVLPDEWHSISAHAFRDFRRVLADIDQGGTRHVLPETTDSAHATGFHSWGGLSPRYNQYRRGFIFSNGSSTNDVDPNVDTLADLLHVILQHVLEAMEIVLELPPQWFQTQLGPTRSHSQWHIKEYKPDVENSNDLWLGTHTDPSLVSVVVMTLSQKQHWGIAAGTMPPLWTWQHL